MIDYHHYCKFLSNFGCTLMFMELACHRKFNYSVWFCEIEEQSSCWWRDSLLFFVTLLQSLFYYCCIWIESVEGDALSCCTWFVFNWLFGFVFCSTKLIQLSCSYKLQAMKVYVTGKVVSAIVVKHLISDAAGHISW